MSNEMKDNIEIYEEFIQNICQFYKRIGIAGNPIKIYEVFRYMYLHGYLSSEKYSDNIPEPFIELELDGYIPMDVTGSMIMANYGVCRHTTDFLSRIYCGLNYESSQLFIYKPDARIIVYNSGRKFLTNYQVQEYIDDAMQELDLFGKKTVHFIKEYGDIKVTVDYFPPEYTSNHTVNIVRKDKENYAHILDTRTYCIGDKIDDKSIILSDLNLGLTYKTFVDHEPIFSTYYDTDYQVGLRLLNTFDTQTYKDILASTVYREECKKYEAEYKKFKLNNQQNLNLVADNFQKLIKRELC